MKKKFQDIRLWLIHNRKKITYWLISGFFMLFVSTLILYILVDYLEIKLLVATIVSAEITLLIRFLINQKVIFKSADGNILRPLIRFHLASASAFIIWWGTTNLLAYNNIHYIYASVIAVAFSSGINFMTNFLWVWKNETKTF